MSTTTNPSLSHRAVSALAVAGAVLLVIASFSFWADRYLGNEQRFVDHSATALNDPAVRQDIAGAVSDDLLGQLPLVQSLAGPALETAIATALGTPGFDTLYRSVAANMHQIMTTGNDLTVSIDAPIVSALVQASLGALSGTPLGDALSDRFVTGAGTTTIVLIDSNDLPPVHHLIQIAPWLVIIGGAGGIILLAVAFWGADDRRSTALWTGATLAVGELVVLLLSYVLRGPATGRSDLRIGRAITEAAYDAVISSLRVQSIVLMIIGVAIVAASFLLRPRQPETAPEAATAPTVAQ